MANVKASQLNVVTAPTLSSETKTWSISHTSLPATTGLEYVPAIAQDPLWLGFKHDGYGVVPITQYRVTRGTQIPLQFNREHAAFMQAWLSFGLLEAVLERPVPESELICQSRNGRPVLSLHALPALLSTWKSQLTTHDTPAMLSYRERAVKSLSHAHRTLQYLKRARAFEYKGAVDDLIPATFCFLGCIGEALTNAMQFLNPELDDALHVSLAWDFVLAFYPLSSPNYVPVADRFDPGHSLDEEEWCPSTVKYLIKRSNVSAFRYALRRGPRNRGESHDKCSEYACVLQSVDVENYVPKHSGILKEEDKCDCSYIKPPFEDVVGALSRGSIPVIRLPTETEAAASDEKLAVSVSSDAPYIAISHVWVDGMGSNTETGLPSCQVWKLAAFAQAMIPTGRFWLDALCVPKQKDARQQALRLMGRAYRDAECVIVRDQTVEACSQDASSEEILLRILASPWMRRLWTLQEALLARRLHFVLRDAVVPFLALLPAEDHLLTNPALAGFAAEIHRLTKLRLHRNTLAFADVARALRWRATSRPSDEIPAVASLLLDDADDGDGDARRRVLDAPVAERMQKLLAAVRKVPKSVVFLSGPKLHTVGFRWAPATFMTVATGQERGGRDMSPTASSLVTPDGLVDSFWVFALVDGDGAGLDGDGGAGRFMKGAEGDHWMLRCGRESFAVSRTRMETGPYRCGFVLCTGPELPGDEQQLCLGVCGSVEKGDGGEGDVLRCAYGTRLVISKSQRGEGSYGDEEELVRASCLGMHRVCIS
ncbi:hypothetical protein BK809_0000608 [Diplodia seriata]|uniref:Heterokaryon incompatibility domain-containing protein n=1 Tax=Diplodia seriata TaxID=420778 RepID=A0A1S8BHE7_9PEZI|nr:hypothetical protein BK809_0000608 [Diplodia seriata]